MASPIIRALTGSADHPELTFRRTYLASAAEVRDACTNPARLGRWLGEIDGAPKAVGDQFTIRLGGDPLDSAACRVLRCADGIVAISWAWQKEPEGVVSARIEAIDDCTTELTVRHCLAQPDHTVEYGGGWEQLLHGLARALGFADPDAPSDDQPDADAVDTWRSISRAPLEIRQRVAAPADRVWAAFSTAEGLRTWWWRHWNDVTIVADARVGGSYRIEAPSAGIVLDGSYLAVEHRNRLAFTWRWSDADGTSVDEAVDITLAPDGDATIVTVRHSGPWHDDAPAASYRQGWAFTLGELAAVVQTAEAHAQ